MDPVSMALIGSSIASILGVGTSIFGGIQAGGKAKKAAKAEAALDLRVTQEKLYNLQQEERQVAGQTRAQAAGSGVKADTGSPLSILAEQARTFARERMITSQVGAEKAELAKVRGDNTASQLRYQGIGQGLQQLPGAIDAFSMYLQSRPQSTGT